MFICRRVVVFFILSCIFIGVAYPVPLAKNASVKLTQEAEYNFEDVLSRVARSESVCIVAEASPYDAEVTKAELDDLLRDKATPSERISAIAERFDYTVKQRGRLYILLKRYSSPRDLPDLTVEECSVSLDNIQRTQGLFQPSQERFGPRPYSGVTQELYLSLTDEQRTLLKAGTLQANTLSREQQQWVASAALKQYFESKQNTMRVSLKDFQSATRADALLTRQEPTVPAAVYWAAPKTSTLDLTYIILPKDMREPGQARARVQEARVAEPKARFLYSISDALKRCADSGSGSVAAVDPRIAAKRVTLFGGELITGVDFLSAAADIYGLQVVRVNSRVLLTLPQAPQKLTLQEMVPALRRLLPGPVARALHLADLDGIYKILQTPEADGKDSPALSRFLPTPEDYYETAIRQLCQRMADYQARMQQEEFPVAALGEERGRLLANLLLWKALAGNSVLFYGLPAEVASFDNLYLLGGPRRTRSGFGLGISFAIRGLSGTQPRSWGGTIYSVYETDPAFRLINSEVGPP